MVGFDVGSVRRAMQEQIRVQPTISFYDVVVDTVVQEQADVEANVALTKRFDPSHM